jgi:two-component system, OmpR family, sensor kinase
MLSLGIVMVFLAVFGSVAYFMLSSNLNRNVDKSLRELSANLTSSITLRNNVITYSGTISEMALIYDSSGKLVQKVGPDADFAILDRLVNPALLGESLFLNETSIANQEIRLYASPLTIQGNRFALIVGRSIVEVNNLLDQYKKIMGLFGIVMLLVAGGVGFLIANRLLKPVDKIIIVTQKINEQNFRPRVSVGRDDEMGKLAAALNEMVDRLETAFKRQQQFTADASHELRTPLSIIRGEAELALSSERTGEEYRKSLEVVDQESNHMSAIIEKLLFLARTDNGKEPLNLQKVDLKELVTTISEDITVLTQEKGIYFKVDAADNIYVNGDKVKLRQLIVSLLDNAIKYTGKAGMISVSLSLKKQKAVIEVSDTGIGISSEHLPFIFDRFYRIDKAHRDGVGLGLAIAKTIAEAHQGSIEVESQIEKGSTFRVTLPVLKML